MLQDELDGLLQQELQLEAKLSLYEALKKIYDLEDKVKSAKELARKPSMSYVKKVGNRADLLQQKWIIWPSPMS